MIRQPAAEIHLLARDRLLWIGIRSKDALHVGPQTYIDHGILLCKFAHGLAKELRTQVYGLFRFKYAG